MRREALIRDGNIFSAEVTNTKLYFFPLIFKTIFIHVTCKTIIQGSLYSLYLQRIMNPHISPRDVAPNDSYVVAGPTDIVPHDTLIAGPTDFPV